MKTINYSHLLIYVSSLLGGVLLWLLSYGQVLANPLIFSLFFFYLIFLPGWLLNRFLRYHPKNFIGQLMVFFLLGISFYFAINFLAIVLALSLNTVLLLMVLIIVILLFAALIYDLRKPPEIHPVKINLLKAENLIFLIILAIGIFILWIIHYKGPSLDGDPYLHLSIIRKALEGESLNIRALALTETQFINPAYIYPVWHIFLASLSKIFNLSIFTVWTNILYPLVVVVIGVWYLLSSMIFKNKIWAGLAAILMLIFTIYGGPGYLFLRMAVPDTLAQFVFLPIGWILAFSYILKERSDKHLLVLNFLIGFILIVLHGPHFFYLLFTTVFFGFFYLVSHFKDQDYKQTLKKILMVFLVQSVAFVLLGLAIELRSSTLSTAITEFYKSSGGVIFSTSFAKFSIVFRYGFFLLFLAILFWRSKRFLIIISLMMMVPIIYWTALKNLFNKLLSGIFTDRLPSNTTVYFFIYALLLGVALYLFDKAISRFSTTVRYITDFILAIALILIVFFELKTQTISDFTYKIFYAKPTSAFINDHLSWFVIGSILLALMVGLIWYLKCSREKFEEVEYRQPLSIFLIVLILSFALISPSIVNASYFSQKPKTLQGEDYFLYLIKNDRQALNVIKKMPSKSVILANGEASKGLSVLTNQYMAYTVGSAYQNRFDWVFDAKNPDAEKMAIVTDPKWAIDYIFLASPAVENSHFQKHPEKYDLIYRGGVEIYKIR